MTPVRRYKNVAQSTASPGRMLVLLMHKAMSCMEIASAVLREPEPDAATVKRGVDSLARATDIVIELANTLDPSKDERLCQTLNDVYTFILWKLTVAKNSKLPKDIDEAARAFRPIADAFEQVVASGGDVGG